MFGNNSICRVWSVIDHGKWSEVSITSSTRTKEGKMQTDFSNKYVKFVGNAHLKRPRPEMDICITSCGVTNIYYKDGVKNFNRNPVFTVFDFDFAEVPRRNDVPTLKTNTVDFETISAGSDLPF